MTAADKVPEAVRLRRPTEADYPRVADADEAWWDDRRPGERPGRIWFRHFAGTCWLAEDPSDGTLLGFLAGFRSADRPEVAVILSVGVHPGRRRRAIGRTLVERFLADARAAGVARVEALAWPGNRRAVTFLTALGFEPDSGPETRFLFGTPAYEGYDFGTEDRARFTRAP